MAGRRPQRVLVAERRPLYGSALSAGIAVSDGLAVAATVHTAQHTLELNAALRPDIVVVDAGLPSLGGVRTCLHLKELPAPPAVMIVDDCPRAWVLLSAIEADADGYTTRDVSLRGFVMALQAIARGEISVPRALQAALIRGLRESQREREWLVQLYGRLTPRERDVLELLADGLRADAAAEVLSISPETVRTHIQNALTKLGLHSRLEAAAFVRRHRSKRLAA